MIEWLTVISMIIVGVILIIAEIIFVPGTTIVGILGLVFMIVGVYFGFDYFSNTTGMVILGSSVLLLSVTIYFSFKSKAWERFSLKGSMQGKVNEGKNNNLTIGLQGIATSTLKPIGKAEFDNNEYEVASQGGYVEAGNKIQIIKIQNNKIIVEPI